MGKNHYFTKRASLPYYPLWKHERTWKRLFFLRNCLLKWLFFLRNSNFYQNGVWVVIFETLFWPLILGCVWDCFLSWFESTFRGGRQSQPILRVPLNNPGTQVPLPRRGLHLLCCSLRFLIAPPVDTEVHTSFFKRQKGFSLNEETRSPFQGGSTSFSFIISFSCYYMT